MALPAVIEPCLPTPGERPPTGSDWVHEIKHDGYRLMARRDALSVGIRLLTRNGYDWSSRYPLIVEGFDDRLAGYLRRRGTVCCNIGFCPGSPPTTRSWSQSGLRSAGALKYDSDAVESRWCPRADGSLVRIFAVLLVKPLKNPGDLVFEHACRMGLEGIVSSDWAPLIAPAAPATG